MAGNPVRIGVLGAARIVREALIVPARSNPDVFVMAIAARDPERAQYFARKHGIPRVHQTYNDLLADSDVDAVYIPLPNSHHYLWSIRALKAGKHVLCEKPFASNAREAEEMAELSRTTGRLLVEAIHYRFHPVAARMKEILLSGQLGRIQSIQTQLYIPIFSGKDIRYQFDLAGGAMMDVGCYAVNLLRFLAGEEPSAVTSACAKLTSPQVDKTMTADFQFARGFTGRIECSIFSFRIFRIGATVRGDRGEMRIFNPFAPQILYRFRVRDGLGWRKERVTRESTYAFQLTAFAKAIRYGEPLPIDLSDAVANMRLIDQIYNKAGLKPRGNMSHAA